MKPAIRCALLVLLLASLAGAAQADFHDTVFCGDLAETDCALLEAAQSNELQQTSGSGVMNLDLVMRDLDEDAPGEYNIALDADVVWSGDLSGFQDMGMASLGMMNDPDDMLVLFGELLSQLSGRVTLSLQMPQGLPDMEDDSVLEALTTGISMEARLVDGDLYLDLASLATIMPAEDGVPSGWLGFNIVELLEASVEMDSMAEGLKDPRNGETETVAEADDQLDVDMEEMEAMIAAWTGPDFLAGFMSVERLEDQTVSDQLVAVFRTVIDLEALFDSSELYTLLRSSVEMSGDGGIDNDDLAGMSMMMGMFTRGMDIEAITYISIDEALPLREEAHFAWSMADMLSMTGEAGTGDPWIGFDYRMDYAYPEEAPVISVPENAFIISPGLLLSGAGAADA